MGTRLDSFLPEGTQLDTKQVFTAVSSSLSTAEIHGASSCRSMEIQQPCTANSLSQEIIPVTNLDAFKKPASNIILPNPLSTLVNQVVITPHSQVKARGSQRRTAREGGGRMQHSPFASVA